jgi:hypothetical protein
MFEQEFFLQFYKFPQYYVSLQARYKITLETAKRSQISRIQTPYELDTNYQIMCMKENSIPTMEMPTDLDDHCN